MLADRRVVGEGVSDAAALPGGGDDDGLVSGLRDDLRQALEKGAFHPVVVGQENLHFQPEK